MIDLPEAIQPHVLRQKLPLFRIPGETLPDELRAPVEKCRADYSALLESVLQKLVAEHGTGILGELELKVMCGEDFRRDEIWRGEAKIGELVLVFGDYKAWWEWRAE